MILIDSNTFQSTSVRDSILKGCNYISLPVSKIDLTVSTDYKFKTDDTEWKKVNDWRRISQNRLGELFSGKITMNTDNAPFMFAGYLHYPKEDTNIPTFTNVNSTVYSEILAYALSMIMQGNLGGAYPVFQSWLFFMSNSITKHELQSSFRVEEKVIIPFSL